MTSRYKINGGLGKRKPIDTGILRPSLQLGKVGFPKFSGKNESAIQDVIDNAPEGATVHVAGASTHNLIRIVMQIREARPDLKVTNEDEEKKQ